MSKVNPESELTCEIGAAMSQNITADLSGVAGILHTCHDMGKLPPGIHKYLNWWEKMIMSKLDALTVLLGAAVHNLEGEGK